ncbi:type II toxin-antitoxin system Phd/YefM family antitoxin [Ilumatobacter sp.]|uniref:type II toxin-antitoxin system Phd/YefM family antitoxin n=1 Tax=Ilumatobacter sp. TaxID=1967498 RepID=UPI00260AF495|nr:type II toxin-antitoxin system prevent-host-death family antitoxin [Ilumatobacter sp.]
MANKSRHVSIRVTSDLFESLEAFAVRRDETVSQSARRIIAEGLAPRAGSAAAIDDAIATLRAVRGQLADEPSVASAAPPRLAAPGPPDVRTVNVLNAKTNLSRLLADVARGEEIVITHAGQPRARLLPFEHDTEPLPGHDDDPTEPPR